MNSTTEPEGEKKQSPLMFNICKRRVLKLESAKKELLDMLVEAVLQIEYLHEKFKETGSGNSVITKAKRLIEKNKS